MEIFSHTKEKSLAQSLVIQLAKDLPPALMTAEKNRKVLSVNKITRLLEKTYALAYKYHQENKLGMIKRAILANFFKWELKNANYPEDFVNVATEGLIMELTKNVTK